MAKRFSDTGKWGKVWFSELSPTHKCFWFYILDSCSTGGIWEANWKLASFHVGERLDPKKVSEAFQKQFVELDGGRRWFIIDFITFQYGQLNPNNPAHKGAIKELQRYSLVASDFSISLPDNALKGPSEELQSTSQGAKDTDIDKGTGKGIGKGREKVAFGEFENVMLTTEQYLKLGERLGGTVRADAAIAILSEAKESKGYKYKSDYATMFTWVIKELEKREAGNGTLNAGKDRRSNQGGSRQRETFTRDTIEDSVVPTRSPGT